MYKLLFFFVNFLIYFIKNIAELKDEYSSNFFFLHLNLLGEISLLGCDIYVESCFKSARLTKVMFLLDKYQKN